MHRRIYIDIEIDFEDTEYLPDDLEEKLYEAICDVVEDLAPDDKDIKIRIEE